MCVMCMYVQAKFLQSSLLFVINICYICKVTYTNDNDTMLLFVLAGILVRAEGLAILTVVRVGFLVTARAGSGIVIAKLGNRSQLLRSQ